MVKERKPTSEEAEGRTDRGADESAAAFHNWRTDRYT